MKSSISEILPQKDPFIFVKSILEFDLTKHQIICLTMFSSDLLYVKNYYPKYLIVPEALLMEAMAQSAILLLYNIEEYKDDYTHVLLTKIENMKFYDTVSSDTNIKIIVTLIRCIDKFKIVDARLLALNNKVLASGIFTLVL